MCHEESALLRTLIVQAGLPFFVEEHEFGMWFLVRRSDKAHHEYLFELMGEGPSQDPK